MIGKTPSTPRSDIDARNARLLPMVINIIATCAIRGMMSERSIKMKKYYVFREDGNYSETWLIVPENKKDIIKSFKNNKNIKYLCKSAIQSNFLNKMFINSKDYYTLFIGE
jgi:hypothetical protein